MGILTLGDFYRKKYGRGVEVLASICIIISYLGWVSAQIVALGIIFSTLSNGTISQAAGSGIGALIVLVYTVWGGMWSVALTDFMQMIIIVLGMAISAFFITGEAGGIANVLSHAANDNKFVFFPDGVNSVTLISFFAALLTMGFGSIPQEDVFQRMMSAKNENTAARGTVIGGSLYLVIAFLPILLAYSAKILMPENMAGWIESDSQLALPSLILGYTPVFVQVMFFGGLLSAIMSTASGTLLAPSAILAQNLLRPYFEKFTDKKLVQLTRLSVVGFFLIVMGFVAYKYVNAEANIFQMVESAYKITLAGAFIPLVFGIILKKPHHVSGFLSLVAGVLVWILVETTAGEIENPQIWYEAIPPQFFGMFASIIGFAVGELLSRLFKEKTGVVAQDA